MRLSYLQNHYNIEDVKDGYRFITDSGVEYFLTFIEYPVVEDYFATKIFMFNIERATPKVGQSDIKLMNTILFVLINCLSWELNALSSLILLIF